MATGKVLTQYQDVYDGSGCKAACEWRVGRMAAEGAVGAQPSAARERMGTVPIPALKRRC